MPRRWLFGPLRRCLLNSRRKNYGFGNGELMKIIHTGMEPKSRVLVTHPVMFFCFGASETNNC
jgi:hypothetical protein